MQYIVAESWAETVFSGIWTVVWLVFAVLVLIGGWKMFVKADRPAGASSSRSTTPTCCARSAAGRAGG